MFELFCTAFIGVKAMRNSKYPVCVFIHVFGFPAGFESVIYEIETQR